MTHWIIYFQKAEAKSRSLEMTPSIMITIRKVRMIRNVLQVQVGSWWLFFHLRPYVSYIFGKLCKIQFIGYNPSYHDHHQEGQDDQECPPSIGRFLMPIFPPKSLSVIYFCKALAKSSSMEMTPFIMITIRKVRMISNIPQKQVISWLLFFHLRPYVHYIFGKLWKNTVKWR